MEDYTEDIYCGITLKWNYVNRTVDISMLGYIKNNYKIMEILSQAGPKDAHTHLNPRSLVSRHKPPSHLVKHQNLMQRELNASNKSLAAFYTKQEQWTRRS